MSISIKKTTCRVLIASMLALSFQAAGAGMIGAQHAGTGQAQADRNLVMQTLARADVATLLQERGVDAAQARERVAVMNDQEVSRLAADIQAAPAGADAGANLLILVALGSAVWYFFFRR